MTWCRGAKLSNRSVCSAHKGPAIAHDDHVDIRGRGAGRPGGRHHDRLPSSVTMSKITVAAAMEVISAWS
jgi:hypothetical protein